MSSQCAYSTIHIFQMCVTEFFCITVVGGIFCVSLIDAEGNCLILFVTDTHKIGHDLTPPLVSMFVLVWLGPNITVVTFKVFCCGIFSAISDFMYVLVFKICRANCFALEELSFHHSIFTSYSWKRSIAKKDTFKFQWQCFSRLQWFS
jgi:hypothetical protein